MVRVFGPCLVARENHQYIHSHSQDRSRRPPKGALGPHRRALCMPPRRKSLDAPIARPQRARKSVSLVERDGGDDDDDDEDDELPLPGKVTGETSAKAALHKGETPIARCALVLEQLVKMEGGAWFSQSVSDDDAPGYSEVILNPMDFGTIRGKLQQGSYGDAIAGFVDDVRLVYANAFTYNWAADNVVRSALRRAAPAALVGRA